MRKDDDRKRSASVGIVDFERQILIARGIVQHYMFDSEHGIRARTWALLAPCCQRSQHDSEGNDGPGQKMSSVVHGENHDLVLGRFLCLLDYRKARSESQYLRQELSIFLPASIYAAFRTTGGVTRGTVPR
jgi:hypothetical protein